MSTISADILDSYVGNSIGEICPNGYAANSDNHCAHFVSHVLRLGFGWTCRAMVGSAQRQAPGANLRVHEVFAQCPQVNELIVCPTFGSSLIFVSAPTNFTGSPVQMVNVRKKHIGVLLDGVVWHYSNSRRQVITQTACEFLYHYPKQTNALWLGTFPIAARPTAYSSLACSTGF